MESVSLRSFGTNWGKRIGFDKSEAEKSVSDFLCMLFFQIIVREQYEIKLDIAPMKVYSMAYRCYISLKEFTSGI